jgi:nickel-dependent lactate racemase
MMKGDQMENIVKVPELAWYGVSDLELPMPENWKVEIPQMAGYKRKALTSEEIRESVRNPIGCRPIRELAKDRKQAVIIFDDMTRTTRAALIVPFILEELAEAGIPDSNIRFIGATGCHGAMNRIDFAKKLGEDVVRKFPVFSHNAFGCCVKAGTTSFGLDIFANAEVMACDLKIAIGTVAPHIAAGFSGGGKIILPGVCSIETNTALHRSGLEYQSKVEGKPTSKYDLENNRIRLNMDEAAEIVGLDIKMDVVIDSLGETVALYNGKPEAAFTEAVKDARAHYLTTPAREKDIVIANTFAKANEFEGGLDIAFPSLKKGGGEVVLIGSAPDGHVSHYLFGAWGTISHRTQMKHKLPPQVNHVYILNKYPQLDVLGHFAPPEKVSISSEWDDILDSLKRAHHGQVEVAVYPNADIQYSGE